MLGVIAGETVKVSLRDFGAKDEFGNPVESFSVPVDVANVLVGRRSTRADEEPGRPYGVESTTAFCFPRDYLADLRGARIERGGKTYEVVGDPTMLTDENLPPAIAWNIRAEAVVRDG